MAHTSVRPDALTSVFGHLTDGGPVICDTGFDTSPVPANEDVEKDFLPAALLDHPRYRIFGRCGSGGMGVVYRAEHRLMGRLVALKVIRPRLLQRSDAVDRFRREVRAASLLSHPNIVATFDAEVSEGIHFLVMEFVEGQDLAHLVGERGRLSVQAACCFAMQAAQGLAHIHACGMVHRDFKPQNLMLTPQGTVKILDFDLSKFPLGIEGEEPSIPYAGRLPLQSGSLTSASASFGTPDFVAPEQAADARATDIRADIYSLGMTLYFLLTGRPPFPGSDILDKLRGHAARSPQAISDFRDDVPTRLLHVIAKMTAKRPSDRFQTPYDVVTALRPMTSTRPNLLLDLARLRRRIRRFVQNARFGLRAKARVLVSVPCVRTGSDTTVLDLPAAALRKMTAQVNGSEAP